MEDLDNFENDLDDYSNDSIIDIDNLKEENFSAMYAGLAFGLAEEICSEKVYDEDTSYDDTVVTTSAISEKISLKKATSKQSEPKYFKKFYQYINGEIDYYADI